jgi:hypothetical protein
MRCAKFRAIFSQTYPVTLIGATSLCIGEWSSEVVYQLFHLKKFKTCPGGIV